MFDNSNMKKLILIFWTVSSSQASALFHFEPGIGYNRGHYQAQRAQGIGLTTKLGLDFTNFFILADIGYHNLQIASIPTSTATDFGLCLGGDFKSWRFWFTYLASATLKTASGGVTTNYKGDGIKLGLSGRLSNKAYMNLEVRFIDINDIDGTAVTQLMDVALLSVSWKLL
jgi:hypothetical protein